MGRGFALREHRVEGDEEAAELFLELFPFPSRPHLPSARSKATAQVREPRPRSLPVAQVVSGHWAAVATKIEWTRGDSNP
jgi:hypothetical protein